MTLLQSPVTIMQNLQCCVNKMKNQNIHEFACSESQPEKCVNMSGHRLMINLTAWLNRKWLSVLILTTHLAGIRKELYHFYCDILCLEGACQERLELIENEAFSKTIQFLSIHETPISLEVLKYSAWAPQVNPKYIRGTCSRPKYLSMLNT